MPPPVGTILISEIIGTMFLILLGDGVVAGVLLNKTKGQNSGWIVITWAWAMAVFVGVFTSAALGGNAHLNPAVTIGLATAGNPTVPWGSVPYYIVGEFIGAFIGAFLVCYITSPTGKSLRTRASSWLSSAPLPPFATPPGT
jgi:glycerol uptake facilitator protein